MLSRAAARATPPSSAIPTNVRKSRRFTSQSYEIRMNYRVITSLDVLSAPPIVSINAQSMRRRRHTMRRHSRSPIHETVAANGLLDRRLFLRGGTGAALALGGIL